MGAVFCCCCSPAPPVDTRTSPSESAASIESAQSHPPSETALNWRDVSVTRPGTPFPLNPIPDFHLSRTSTSQLPASTPPNVTLRKPAMPRRPHHRRRVVLIRLWVRAPASVDSSSAASPQPSSSSDSEMSFEVSTAPPTPPPSPR